MYLASSLTPSARIRKVFPFGSERAVSGKRGLPTVYSARPGVCRPELWEEYVPRKYGMNGNNTRVEAILTLLSERLRGRQDRFLLDVWHTQYPASQHEEKLLPDGRLDCSVNDVHLGYFGQRTAAAQVLGWLYHLLAR